MKIEPRCKHLVLDECSQKHHDNCVGLRQCILDMEKQNLALNQKLKLAVEALENTQDTLVVAFAGNVSDCDYLDRIDGQWAINNEALTKIGQVE